MAGNSLVENSYYDHEDHGKVRVVAVDETVVTFQIVNRHHYFPGGHKVLSGKYEAVSEFIEKTEPATVNIVAEPAVIRAEARDAGGPTQRHPREL